MLITTAIERVKEIKAAHSKVHEYNKYGLVELDGVFDAADLRAILLLLEEGRLSDA